VLEQPHGLLLYQLRDHVAQNRTDGVKPLVGVTNVRKSHIVQQYLLHNEDSDRFA
jgi:hypothetical protein